MIKEQPAPAAWLISSAVVLCLGTAGGVAISPLVAPTSPEDAIIKACWWAGLALACWYVISVILWCLALWGHGPQTNRSMLEAMARWIALPGSRLLAERTLAIALIITPTACSVGADRHAPALSLISRDAATEPALESTVPPSSLIPSISTEPPQVDAAVAIESADVASPDPVIAAGTYEVRSGDSFWAIARTLLAEDLGRDPSSSEVAPYWRALIGANRELLISGDPNLIHPGEIFQLPNQG